MSNVLFISPGFPPSVNGVGDYTYQLAKEFVRGGHRVHVVCPMGEGGSEQVDGIHVHRRVRQWSGQAHRAILQLIEEEAIELVILEFVPHGYHPKGLPFALLPLVNAVRRKSVRWFTFFHEVYIDSLPGNLRRNIGAWLMRRLSRSIARRSDIVATSITRYRYLLSQLLAPRETDIAVIPIASNVPEHPLSTARREKLRRDIAPSGELIVAFFGARDIQSSLQALHSLHEEGLSLRILLIGKIKAQVPAAIEPLVHRTGLLPLDDIGPYLQAADVLVLPEPMSWGASFKSGSLIAGLRAGLPVVSCQGMATDTQVLHNGENILFTDFDNPAQLLADLRGLLSAASLREKLSAGARAVSRPITWPATYAAYQTLIASHA